jgi:hypothetical protein
MKQLILLIIVILWAIFSYDKSTIKNEIDEQVEHSTQLHDSALLMLEEIHDVNDSLIDVYFPITDSMGVE